MKPLVAGVLFSSFFAASSLLVNPELIFSKGTLYVYKGEILLKGQKNLKYVEYVKITDVTVSGNNKSSSGLLTYTFDKGQPADPSYCKFACDSLNFYIHTSNFAFQTEESIKKGSDVITGDSLIYPLQMKVGDTLPDAWYKNVRSANDVSSTTTVKYTNRKVESLDTLNLAFGKIAAFKITMTETSQTKGNSRYTGKYDNKEVKPNTEWFSPELGIVKSVSGSGDTGDIIVLESYSMK